MEKKNCIECGQEIAASEKKCPACSADLETLEQEVEVVERAQKLIEKKKARETPPPPSPETTPAKKKSIFASLGELK